MSNALQSLVALGLVALISVGCSNTLVGTATGSTGTRGGTASAAPAATDAASSAAAAPSLAPGEQALKFAECMRDNGVKGFPDPDASGSLTLDGIVNGSTLDPNSASWKKAISTCIDLEPAGFTGHTRTADQQAVALKFAQCIRDHGVKDFPDPAPDAPLVDTDLIPSTEESGGMTILNAAMRTCRAFSEAAGVNGQ